MVSEVHNVDCVEYMRTLPDNHFDIAICDTPYGDADNGNFVMGGAVWRSVRPLQATDCDSTEATGGIATTSHKLPPPNQQKPTGIHTQGGTWATKYKRPSNVLAEADSADIHCSGGRTQKYYKENDGKLQRIDWDIAPTQEFWNELFRVSKNQVIWGGNYFWLPPTRCFLIWRKLSISEKFSMAMCEYAWTSFNANAKLFEMPPQRGDASGKFHPTEKPIALYNWILGLFAKEGDKIFDPMMGSQSSRCAAYLSGFDYYGCEIDKYYFDKGNEFFERICHGVKSDGKGNKLIQKSLF